MKVMNNQETFKYDLQISGIKAKDCIMKKQIVIFV